MEIEDDRNLVQLLNQCQNPESVNYAQSKLATYEKEPQFYTSLLEIFQNQSIGEWISVTYSKIDFKFIFCALSDGNVRFMAALYFKNGVEKYWRVNQANAIRPEEKATLKQSLLYQFREPVPLIALQIAVIISKIARLDCPNNWPELMPLLLERVRSTDELEQHRSILILLHVVKALASKRLHQDRMVFEVNLDFQA